MIYLPVIAISVYDIKNRISLVIQVGWYHHELKDANTVPDTQYVFGTMKIIQAPHKGLGYPIASSGRSTDMGYLYFWHCLSNQIAFKVAGRSNPPAGLEARRTALEALLFLRIKPSCQAMQT